MPEHKLKSCPFCGFRRPIIRTYKGKNGFRDRYAVLCDYNNGGCGAESGHYHYISEACDRWNERAYENRFDRRRRTHNYERHLPEDTTAGK